MPHNSDLAPAQIAPRCDRFPPSRAAALTRLRSFAPYAAYDYQAKRNFDLGPSRQVHVSQLSPYLRNGVLSEAEVVSIVLNTHTFKEAEKFLQEVFWRVYWKGYLENRPGIWTHYQSELVRLLETASDTPSYQAAIQATTGIECFDTWSRELIETGYLHNHARMWFASIWIFTLKLPWQLGADFFLRHLLDGDPASNTLSWRWVAGLHTKGKTYLARPSNIERYTADRFAAISGLATQAPAIEEQDSIAPATYNKLPLPPATLRRGQGLLLLDEDLRNHIPAFQQDTPILGLYPETIYTRSGVSAKVSNFRRKCLGETLDRLASKHGCAFEFSSNPSAAEIIEWAKKHDLVELILAQPQVGPWRDLWDELAAPLADAGIRLTCFRPWWENELFPCATSGFFKFKKGIEVFKNPPHTIPL